MVADPILFPPALPRRARIGGLPLAELNALELDFLFAVDFDLGVRPADYAACTADLAAFATAARNIPPLHATQIAAAAPCAGLAAQFESSPIRIVANSNRCQFESSPIRIVANSNRLPSRHSEAEAAGRHLMPPASARVAPPNDAEGRAE